MPLHHRRVREVPVVFGRPAWCSNHQVSSSCSNARMPKTQRAYFDDLSFVQFHGAELVEVPAPRNGAADSGISAYEMYLRRRYRQFPHFFSTGRRIRKHQEVLQATHASTSTASDALAVVPVSRPVQTLRHDDMKLLARVSEATPSLQPRLDSWSMPLGLPGILDIDDESETLENLSEGDKTNHTSNRPFRRATKRINYSVCTVTDCTSIARKCLTEWLISKNLNEVSLWRRLDADGNMTLHKREFVTGMKNLHYPGDVEALWSDLDQDTTGTISFIEFAPEHAIDLARFRNWAFKGFGSMRGLFKAMDADKNGRITFAEFSSLCAEVGLPDRLTSSVELIFKLVDDANAANNRGTITASELDFLDVWKPPLYLWGEPDTESYVLFREALLKKYNFNSILAWRIALDKDSSMRVSYDEFIAQCRTLCKNGGLLPKQVSTHIGIYCVLDKDRRGWFSFQDYDEQAFQVLAKFARFAKEQSANSKVTQWVKNLEDANEGSLSFSIFRREMKSIGIVGQELSSLYEGLTLCPIVKQQGAIHAGRLTLKDVAFLDHWQPESDIDQSNSWKRIATKKLTANEETFRSITRGLELETDES